MEAGPMFSFWHIIHEEQLKDYFFKTFSSHLFLIGNLFLIDNLFLYSRFKRGLKVLRDFPFWYCFSRFSNFSWFRTYFCFCWDFTCFNIEKWSYIIITRSWMYDLCEELPNDLRGIGDLYFSFGKDFKRVLWARFEEVQLNFKF